MPSGSSRPFRPWSKQKPRVYGTPPSPLPQVVTVGIREVTATTATIIGSINPQGLSGTCWFVYGITPTFGSQTSTVSVPNVSAPVLEEVTLTGLTTGTQYYAALVGNTLGGTVTSNPVTFVAATPSVVTNASEPLTPTGTPAVAIPHFQFPFTVTPTGAQVVEQDSLDEIFSNVQTVVACPIGACPDLPTFGIPDPTFQPGPPNTNAIVSAIIQWEPRATESAMTYALDNSGGNWGVTLTTHALGTGQ